MSQKDQKWQQLGDRLSGFQATGDPSSDFAQFQQLLQQQNNNSKDWWQKPYIWFGLLLATIVTATALTYLTEASPSSNIETAPASEALSNVLSDHSIEELIDQNPTNYSDDVDAAINEVDQSLASANSSEASLREVEAELSQESSRSIPPHSIPAVLNADGSTDLTRSPIVSPPHYDQSVSSSSQPEQATSLPSDEPSITDEQTSNSENETKNLGPSAAPVISPAAELIPQRVNQLSRRGLQPLDVEQKLPTPDASAIEPPSLSDKASRIFLQLRFGLSFHLPSFQVLSFDPGTYVGFNGHYRINERWELGGQVELSTHSLDILKSDTTPISTVERSISWTLPNGFVQESNWNADLEHVNMLSLAATARYRLKGPWRVSGGIQYSRLLGVSDWLREIRGGLTQLDPFRNLNEYPLRRNNWSLLLGLEYRISPSWSIEAQAAPSFQDITPNEFDAERHTATTLSVGLSYRL